jgi:hypothetical protein
VQIETFKASIQLHPPTERRGDAAAAEPNRRSRND